MAETTQVSFTHKEIAEILVRSRGIHEGFWGIFVRFGLRGANVGNSDSDLMPAAIVPIVEVGLQRFEKENNLSVDAAKVNPEHAGERSKRRRR
ncbi:MAG: hypothetical protein AB1806_04415 [Acidobacteriota bacterium]